MRASYTGSGPYCYSDSLHMCLREAGAGAEDLPETGFLECLTTLPFGNTYRRAEDPAEGPQVFFDGCDPDRGLRRTMDALGWACEESHGGDGDEAMSRLRRAVETGPALVGPLDMGLPYNPSGVRGADHFLVALEAGGGRVLVHDPAGFPFAVLGTDELLAAWRAEAVDYKRGPYTLRAGFRRAEQVGRGEAIRRTLPLARENVAYDPGGPEAYGGKRALELLADDLRDGDVPPALAENLTHFGLPLAARRRLDASQFLAEAGETDAAGLAEREAVLFGEAQSLAARGRWVEVAGVVELFGRDGR